MFFEILPMFSDFVNSDGYIGKITSKSSDYSQVLLKNIFDVNKIQFFSIENMRNSSNHIYD